MNNLLVFLKDGRNTRVKCQFNVELSNDAMTINHIKFWLVIMGKIKASG